MIADHIVFPSVVTSKYPYTVSGIFPGEGDALEQLALMAFIAGKTERLRLVTSVMILPYRNPVATAKTLATIDVLSRGRVTVGVGVGWLREEFAALGAADFDRRGAVSDEYLRIFGAVDRIAVFVRGGVLPLPRRALPAQPVQAPHPPIWIGGHSKAALRRVARLGDGWHPVGANPAVPLTPADLRRDLDELYRLTEAEGRDPSALTISYKAPLYDASRPVAAGADRRPFSGSTDQIAEDIATYERLGVGELIFDFRSEDLGREHRAHGALRSRHTVVKVGKLADGTLRGMAHADHPATPAVSTAPAPEPLHRVVPGRPAVRGFLHRPASPARDGLVLTHGAGGNSSAKLLVALGLAFAEAGLVVLRCDLPYRQDRPKGPPFPSGAARDRDGLRQAVAASGV